PEWIEMSTEKTEEQTNVFPAKVLKRVYYGRHIHYVLGLAGHEVDVETPFDVDVPVGADVTVGFPSNRCVCLEADPVDPTLDVDEAAA
ncbi:MAG: TOBE domain-containing protein, partial [Rhodospirillaceae bacterium]|nr:TOBE domain-containing protein [Rhodospirillaceae bacterium]